MQPLQRFEHIDTFVPEFVDAGGAEIVTPIARIAHESHQLGTRLFQGNRGRRAPRRVEIVHRADRGHGGPRCCKCGLDRDRGLGAVYVSARRRYSTDSEHVDEPGRSWRVDGLGAHGRDVHVRAVAGARHVPVSGVAQSLERCRRSPDR